MASSEIIPILANTASARHSVSGCGYLRVVLALDDNSFLFFCFFRAVPLRPTGASRYCCGSSTGLSPDYVAVSRVSGDGVSFNL